MAFFFEHHGMAEKNLFRVNRMRNEAFPAHLHHAYELIYVNSGTLSLQVEQKQYQMQTGDLAFLFGNQIHSFSPVGEADISVVLFSPEIIGAFYSAHKDQVPARNVFRLNPPLDFATLHTLYAQKGALYTVCDALLSSTEMEQGASRSQVAVLQQIFAHVDKHFGEECSLKSVAKALQYDYAYLSKLFTRLAGMHFTEYLNNYRIAQACYLLGSGSGTISDIAIRCGYANLRTFHRNFQRVMCCSPREYLAEALHTRSGEQFGKKS